VTATVYSPEVEEALARIEGHKTGADPKVVAFWDIIGEAIKECGDPVAVLGEVTDLIQRRLGGALL
jgi:hypothetical protein